MAKGQHGHFTKINWQTRVIPRNRDGRGRRGEAKDRAGKGRLKDESAFATISIAMRAKETTFRELYAGNVVYVTPTFQRAYGHTENAVKRMLAAALAADAPPYFLGALVTRELGPSLPLPE